MQDELSIAARWLQQGRMPVLAVVTRTWGSAPRPVGSLMVIDRQGRFKGSVSGGCIEADIVAEASMGRPGSLICMNFGVSSETAFAAGLACGGEIEIALLPLSDTDLPALDAALAALAGRHSGALESRAGGALQFQSATPHDTRPLASTRADHLYLRLEQTPRLIITGAVHIAEYLVPIAAACGFACTVIDPRAAFVDERDLGGAITLCDWPDEALQSLAPDPQTALVTLTHDPKLDDAALIPALASPAFYVGALGSRKTHRQRLARLAEKGVDGSAAARISAPVGLDIGAATPAEIAVAIMAEITQARRGG